MKMRRCEDEKMRYRPPLLEEPCAQTLSGKKSSLLMYHHVLHMIMSLSDIMCIPYMYIYIYMC